LFLGGDSLLPQDRAGMPRVARRTAEAAVSTGFKGFVHQTWQALVGIMGWPVLQPKARPNSGMF
jgi:hypothetical protein